VLPKIETLHVHITVGPQFYTNTTYNASSAIETANGVPSTVGDLHRIRIYDQLSRALTPFGQLSLKGELVRIVPLPNTLDRHRFLSLAGGISVSTSGDVTIAAGDGDMIETIVDNTESRARAVLGLNTAIAALVAIAVTYSIHYHGRALIRGRHRERRATELHDTPSADFQSTGPMHGINPMSTGFTAFELPVELINLLLPYRR
jgi:hypothetical protein